MKLFEGPKNSVVNYKLVLIREVFRTLSTLRQCIPCWILLFHLFQAIAQYVLLATVEAVSSNTIVDIKAVKYSNYWIIHKARFKRYLQIGLVFINLTHYFLIDFTTQFQTNSSASLFPRLSLILSFFQPRSRWQLHVYFPKRCKNFFSLQTQAYGLVQQQNYMDLHLSGKHEIVKACTEG